jgi:hypothetical protein
MITHIKGRAGRRLFIRPTWPARRLYTFQWRRDWAVIRRLAPSLHHPPIFGQGSLIIFPLSFSTPSSLGQVINCARRLINNAPKVEKKYVRISEWILRRTIPGTKKEERHTIVGALANYAECIYKLAITNYDLPTLHKTTVLHLAILVNTD